MRSNILQRALLVLVVIAWLVPGPLRGAARAGTDSTKRAIAEQRMLLQMADSAEDVASAIAVRSRLATMVGPREAIRLLEEAAALAHATGRLEEEIAVRTYLGMAHASVKDHRQAYARSMEVIALSNELMSIQAGRSGARTDSLLAAAKEAHMATIRADMLRQLEADDVAAHHRRIAQRWMMITIGLLVVAVLAAVLLLFRVGRRSRRTQGELAMLRAEVDALRRASDQRVPDPSRRVEPGPPPGTVTAQVDPPVDEVVRAMFLERAPERLATLRDARSRNDHEKVIRVVHTLKPQLAAHDVSLGELCRSITGATGDRPLDAMHADLDRLEAAIERLLK